MTLNTKPKYQFSTFIIYTSIHFIHWHLIAARRQNMLHNRHSPEHCNDVPQAQATNTLTCHRCIVVLIFSAARLQTRSLGAVHKWRQHFLGSLTPLGAYVSLSSAFGMPLGASNWWRHLWTTLNQKWSFLESSLFPSDLTESVLHMTWPLKTPNHLLQKGSSSA